METNTTVLAVEGMTCSSCIAHVTRALLDLDGVREARVSFRERVVVVRHEPIAAVDMLVEALREAGYESSARD